jgi:hypothetical protein
MVLARIDVDDSDKATAEAGLTPNRARVIRLAEVQPTPTSAGEQHEPPRCRQQDGDRAHATGRVSRGQRLFHAPGLDGRIRLRPRTTMGFTRHAGGRPANRSWWRGPLRRSTGTYDRSVGLSLFTLQITHKIEADIDVERDHAVATMRQSCKVGVDLIRDFSTGYHSRNGGGDVIRTDGDLPIIDVRQVSAEARPRSSKPTAGTTVRRRSWSEPPSPPCAASPSCLWAWCAPRMPGLSSHAEAEGMACRIEEDAKRCPRLVLMLHSSEFEHSSLRDIKVVDGDVQVHLLRCGRARPHRRGETVDFLEPDRIAIVGPDVSPVLLDLNGPVEQSPVERGQCRWIGTVDDDGWIARDGHEANLDLRSDNETLPDAVRSSRPPTDNASDSV